MSSSTSNDVNYVNKHILCRLLRGWQLTGDVKHRWLNKSGIRGPCFTDNADLLALGCSFMPAAAAHPQAAPPTTGAPLQLDWRHCWRTGPGVARRSKADTRKPEKEVFLAGTERRGGGGSDWSWSSPLKQHMQHCAPLNLSFLSIPFCFAQSCHPQSLHLPVWLHFVRGNKFGYGENVILMLSHNLLPQLPWQRFNAFFVWCPKSFCMVSDIT